MKKFLAFMMVFVFVCVGCIAEGEEQFRGLNDPNLLPYLRDTVYESAVANLNSEEYFVENVSAIYISDEYLEELEFNSQANIYFGYSLDELEQQFQGQRYVFTLSDTNETIVKPWEPSDDIFQRVMRDVAIGTGVILICVTVSVVSAGVGAPAISMIFAMAAKTGAIGALSGGTIGALVSGTVEYIRTGDSEQAFRAAALGGAQGYKLGAITGAISGGASEAIMLKGAACNGLTMNQAAMIQRESGYPLSLIKQFHSVEEYQAYRDAGLFPKIVGNKTALIRDIDLTQKDAFGRTNLQRMLSGDAPLDPQGIAYELHHVGQHNDSVLAVLTQAEHRGQGAYKILHVIQESEIDRQAFNLIRREFWQNAGRMLGGL